MIKQILCGTALSAIAVMAQATDTSISYSLTPVMVPEFDLNSGGTADATWMMASVGVTKNLAPRTSLGVDISATRQDWNFNSPKAWGAVTEPWGTLHRWSVSVPYRSATSSGWFYTVAPGVELAAESGASNSDSLSYGATAFAAKMFSPGLMLGLGVSAWSGLEEASVFPFVVVQWQITEQLRLANPFNAGPAGPAGLELSWQASPALQLAAGGTVREFTSRLSAKNQVAANGLLEDSSMPLFVRASYTISKELQLDAYAGAALGGEFKIKNQQNQLVRTEEHDAMPFFAISASGQF
jgi:hypothetical protein